jgi:hypothetical protein
MHLQHSRIHGTAREALGEVSFQKYEMAGTPLTTDHPFFFTVLSSSLLSIPRCDWHHQDPLVAIRTRSRGYRDRRLWTKTRFSRFTTVRCLFRPLHSCGRMLLPGLHSVRDLALARVPTTSEPCRWENLPVEAVEAPRCIATSRLLSRVVLSECLDPCRVFPFDIGR